MTVHPSNLGPQGPFSIKICERLLLSYTAWCLPTCLVRRWSYKGAQQLPSCHGYARAGGEISTQNAANFGLGRPQWAEARRTQGLVFGAAGRKCLYSRRASPVNGGPGKGDYERPLRVGAHRSRPRRRFGYFAAVGKVTFSPWKAKRNARACPGVSHRKQIIQLPPRAAAPYTGDPKHRRRSSRSSRGSGHQ